LAAPGVKLKRDDPVCTLLPISMSLSASNSASPATLFRLAASLARLRAVVVLCDRLNSFAAARAAESVAVRSSVRASCIQATSMAKAAMIMHNGKQIAIKNNIAARRLIRRILRRFMELDSLKRDEMRQSGMS
jgi:hypothetical protein